MTYVLGTSRGAITKAPLLLIDLETEEGVTGRAYLWCYLPRGDAGDRQHPRGGARHREGRARRAGRALGASSRSVSR